MRVYKSVTYTEMGDQILYYYVLVSFQVTVHYIFDLVGHIIAGVVSYPFSKLMF